ncbi:hypothetical protein [Nonomuraea sp. NPDC050691]|uniref:hypothetical protein n=1 Tax=Nonomuraea sp. NPDC050691 TaxID=3155661 RepID=UPI0033C408AF
MAEMLDDLAGGLGSLAYGGYRFALPSMALGAAAEWPARYDYGQIWDGLREEFLRGSREGAELAERLRRTRDGYDRAEDAGTTMSVALGRVIAAVREAQAAPSALPPAPPEKYDPLGLDDEPFPWLAYSGLPVVAAGSVGRTHAGFMAKDLAKHEAWQRARIAGRVREIKSYAPSFAEVYKGEELSRLAKATEGTRLNIATVKAFSWTVVAAGLAWLAVVVPSDEDIDRAIAGWTDVADRCGELFGHDTGPVREAIAAAWAGPAMEAADARLVEFIAAGVHVADRTRRLAQALIRTVRDLDRIFMAVLIFSGASAAAIAGLGIAARFNPALRPAVEFLGTRLGTVVVLCANLAPAVAAFAVAWYRVADANAPTRIGDREITGFRQS